MINAAEIYLEITGIKLIGEYKLEITFNDGTNKEIDFHNLLSKNYPVFELLKDKKAFKKFSISSTGGISWDCGADLCADVLKNSFDLC